VGAAFHYDALPVFDAFERVSDPTLYTPLPDDWHVGVADVVKSTAALKAGRYKAINMAGASIVAAVKNALRGAPFPFVFGGDGAVLAVPGGAAVDARSAMARCANYVADELDLTLRVGMISVAAIRAAGHDMRVARYAASSEAVYAMFFGGGASYAEAELKAGRIAIEPAPPGARPDLSGLSCRFSPLRAQNGVILSLLVMPAPAASPEEFTAIATEVVRMIQKEERGGHPVPPDGPELGVNMPAIRLEAAQFRNFPGSYFLRLGRVVAEMAVGSFLSRTGRKLGRLDVRHYRRWVTRNSDFRKFDDGLRMTIDCKPATADALEAYLAEAERAGTIAYGLHRQEAALITCLVPSVLQDDHLHFLDGAGGGYALAAETLKRKLAGLKGAAAVAAA
jgi:hypothetical protein